MLPLVKRRTAVSGLDSTPGQWNNHLMHFGHPCRFDRLLGFVLAGSIAPGCSTFLALDEFSESVDAGGPEDSGQDAEDAKEAGPCTLSITPQSHNFGPVTVGTTSSPVQFTIVNEQHDSIGPLTLSGGATPNPDFVIVAQNCEDRTLTRGTSCTVDFVFAPDSPGFDQTAILLVQVGNQVCATAFLEGGAPPL